MVPALDAYNCTDPIRPATVIVLCGNITMSFTVSKFAVESIVG